MHDLNKDILVGVLYFGGIASFISGLFIVSAVIFASASMLSNMTGKAVIEG